MHPTRINLHAHTTYSSDGLSRMEEMAEAARQNSHCCLCVTDHDGDFIQNPKIFMKQLREDERLSKAMKFPIIVGMEITLPPVEITFPSEEALLFGHNAIIKWLDFHNKGLHLESVCRGAPFLSFQDECYAMVLAHPRLVGGVVHQIVLSCHGYEIANRGYRTSPEKAALLDSLPMAGHRRFTNSDAHECGCFSKPGRLLYNSTSKPITNEQELISWIRGENV